MRRSALDCRVQPDIVTAENSFFQFFRTDQESVSNETERPTVKRRNERERPGHGGGGERRLVIRCDRASERKKTRGTKYQQLRCACSSSTSCSGRSERWINPSLGERRRQL